jgi:hypothetical protein
MVVLVSGWVADVAAYAETVLIGKSLFVIVSTEKSLAKLTFSGQSAWSPA